MTKTLLFLMAVLICPSLYGAPVFIDDKGAPMIKGENGVFVQLITAGFNAGSLAYIADIETKICMTKWMSRVGGGAPIIIDCSSLAQRQEWKKVITWTD
jgi:hypothetical protein